MPIMRRQPALRHALSLLSWFAAPNGYHHPGPRNKACPTCRGIRLGDRAPAKQRTYLLPEQLSPLLNSLFDPCRKLVTGLRIAELLALRWKHVDFVHHVIHVRETV